LELGGEFLGGSCDIGCPAACCSEDDDGNVQCEIRLPSTCTAPSVVADSCEPGCLGECCVDGVSQGQTTQPECLAIGGSWAGIGSTNCNDGNCRDPFTEECCETKQSIAAGLVFTQPRNKRSPAFSDTLRVTVTGTTDSPILIHGTPFGVDASPAKRCPINHTFLICWDKFNIEPVPCGTNFRNLDVEVCWSQAATDTETLNFSACDGLTVWLGYTPYNCVTTLVYTGGGKTTNATIQMLGDGIIEANGSGPLSLTSGVTWSDPNTTLTFAGENTDDNYITAIAGTKVRKTGVGTWVFGTNSFTGRLTIEQGTIVAATNAPGGSGTSSSLGKQNGPIPLLGLVDGTGTAALLAADDVTIARVIEVAALGSGSQEVVLGGSGAGTATFDGNSAFRLGRGVTLAANAGGNVRFLTPTANWGQQDGSAGPAVAVTIGTPTATGTVTLETTLPNSITAVAVRQGTLRLGNGTTVGALGPASVLSGSAGATLAFNRSDTITSGVHFANSIGGAMNVTQLGSGTVILAGVNTYTGTTTITNGALVLNAIVSGPAIVTSATLTPSSLTVAFSAEPETGDVFQLLSGPTAQTYGTVTLTGTTKTGTYDSATSTLTIN
jgi:autotransporter-associated beta strand protein